MTIVPILARGSAAAADPRLPALLALATSLSRGYRIRGMDAGDVAQEAIQVLLRVLPGHAARACRCTVEAFITNRVTAHLFRLAGQQGRRAVRLRQLAGDVAQVEPPPVGQQATASAEWTAALAHCRLPARTKLILEMTRTASTDEQIADHLHTSVGAVRVARCNGLARLRQENSVVLP